MRKKRCALFISSFLPFFMRYWLEVFNQQWADEIDMVYLGWDKRSHFGCEEYIHKIFKHNKIVLVEDTMYQFHGIKRLFNMGSEELVAVLHDDTFIKKGTLDKYFKLVERGEIIVPLYNHYSPPDYIEEVMRKRFGERVPLRSEDDAGYSFLLYFLLVQRKQLEKTSCDFTEVVYKKGEYCPPLNMVVEKNIGGDTGLKLGLEFLANGETFHPISHKHNTTYYLATEENPLEQLLIAEKEGTGLFSSEWVHIMAMANSFNVWFSPGGKSSRNEQYERFKSASFTHGTEMRLGWLLECMSIDTFDEIAEYRDYISGEIDDMVKTFHLDLDRMKTYKSLFHKIIWGKKS